MNSHIFGRTGNQDGCLDAWLPRNDAFQLKPLDQVCVKQTKHDGFAVEMASFMYQFLVFVTQI